MTTDSHTYTVKWSTEDGEYVGLCNDFPSLSWLDKTPQKALAGILDLVTDAIDEQPPLDPRDTFATRGVLVTENRHHMLRMYEELLAEQRDEPKRSLKDRALLAITRPWRTR